MRTSPITLTLIIAAFAFHFGICADTIRVAAQFPSPMVEHTRNHQRIAADTLPGIRFELKGLLPRDASVFIDHSCSTRDTFDLLFHFLGASSIVDKTVQQSSYPTIGVLINLGSGSTAFNKPFVDPTVFPRLVDSIITQTEMYLRHRATIHRIILSGFSAGYGAIRRILSTEENYQRIDAVLLLDGIHASYVPEGKVLSEGGRIDSTHLDAFLKLAFDASRPNARKKFLITHSEIFPGTFVSTTEATDFILDKLHLKRTPVLQWGPFGMQQLSMVKESNFEVRGFAGNAAPDHVDHLHALWFFLHDLLR